MKKLLAPFLVAAALAVCAIVATEAQVPLGLMRFGTTGVFPPQAGNCLSIFAMNSSGQSATDSGTPCTPVVLTTNYTNATTGYTAVAALPTVQGPLVLRGECSIVWETSSTSGTPTFAIQTSAAPTDLWVTAVPSSGAYVAPSYTTITSTTQTAITGALTAAGATTPYRLAVNFALQNPAGANTVTVYANSNNASYTTTVLAGSSCQWVP